MVAIARNIFQSSLFRRKVRRQLTVAQGSMNSTNVCRKCWKLCGTLSAWSLLRFAVRETVFKATSTLPQPHTALTWPPHTDLYVFIIFTSSIIVSTASDTSKRYLLPSGQNWRWYLTVWDIKTLLFARTSWFVARNIGEVGALLEQHRALQRIVE